MNPLWVKALPWVLVAVFAALCATIGHLYLSEHDALAELKGQVEATARAAKQAVQDAKTEGEANLKQIKEDHEKRLPEIRNLAVRNYLAWMRKQSAASAGKNSNATGQQTDDGALEKCMADPTITGIVATAGEDVAIRDEWIDYCQRNRCPIVE
jgi:hypothetical protein